MVIKTKRNPELTQGNMKVHMIRLAIPLILGNILQQTYNTIDAFVIGKYAGELEFSSVGVASSIMNLMIFAIVGACAGTSIIFSELYGGEQINTFRTEHFLALALGTCFTFGMGILAALFLTPILHLTQTPVEIIGYTARYLRIVLLGLPFVFLYNLYNALLGKLMVQSAVNTSGTEMIAAYTAATSVIIAQNHGAGKQARVKKGFGNSFVLLSSLGILCPIALYLAAPKAVAVILGHANGLSCQNAVSYLRIIAFFYPFCFIGNTFAGYLDGIEKVSIPFIGAAGHIALRVILSWLFIPYYQLPAVAFATGTGWVLVNLFWSVYLLRLKRRP